MPKISAPYECAFSLNHEILHEACEISFAAGRLSCFPSHSLDKDSLAKDLKTALEEEGVTLSASQFRALQSGEKSGNELADSLFSFLLKLPSISPYEPSFLSAFESSYFLGEAPHRYSRKIEGFPYRIPEASRLEALTKGVFAYAKQNKEHIHPLIMGCLLHFEILAISPYAKGNLFLANVLLKAFLAECSVDLMNVPIFALLLNQQEELKAAFASSFEKGDTAPYVLACLHILKTAISTRIRHNVHTRSNSTPLLDRLLAKMEEGRYYSATELCALLGLSSRLGLQKNYLRPGIERGKIAMSNPLVPTDRNQRYKKAS